MQDFNSKLKVWDRSMVLTLDQVFKDMVQKEIRVENQSNLWNIENEMYSTSPK